MSVLLTCKRRLNCENHSQIITSNDNLSVSEVSRKNVVINKDEPGYHQRNT